MTELWCYFQGKRDYFKVSIPRDRIIDDLKTQIYTEQCLQLIVGRSQASDLKIWKLKEVFPVRPTETPVECFTRNWFPGPDSPQFAKELEPANSVAEVWPEPPLDDQLHIFVTLLDVVDQPPQKRRQVEVTRSHYDALQNRLNRKYPDRNTKEYDGRAHDVLKDKLDILKQTTPAESDNHKDRVDDDDGLKASDEDDFEMNSYFPFTLKYLDLSTLGLENESDRFPLVLFRRQECDHISNLIPEPCPYGHTAVIVSGQPGTGKAVCLHLRIIESLIAGRPFLYQSNEGVVYQVAERGVEVIEWWSSKIRVAFVDSSEGNYEPKAFLLHSLDQVIVASSLEGAYQSWIMQATCIIRLATRLWSPHELFLTGIFLHRDDITFKRLRESTSYFGYNPRQSFDASSSVTRLKAKMDEVVAQISDIEKESIVKTLASCRIGADAVSHTIFQLQPTTEDRQLDIYDYETVSRWAFNSLLDVCEKYNANAGAELYQYFRPSPYTRTNRVEQLLRFLFERRVFS